VKKFHDALANASLDHPGEVNMEDVDPLYKKVVKTFESENWKEMGGHLAKGFASKIPGDIEVPGESDSGSS